MNLIKQQLPEDEKQSNVTRINKLLKTKIVSKRVFTDILNDEQIEEKIEKLKEKMEEKEKKQEQNKTTEKKELDQEKINTLIEKKREEITEKNNKKKKKIDDTFIIWKKQINDEFHNYSTKGVEFVEADVKEWFGLDTNKLRKARENLYPEGENTDTMSVNYITKVITDNHNNDVEEWAKYYFPYKTIGDFSQILDCFHFRELNEDKVVSPIFLTFDRIAALISSMFNRTIFESQSTKGLVSLDTFIYKSDIDTLNDEQIEEKMQGVEFLGTLAGLDVSYSNLQPTRSLGPSPAGSRPTSSGGLPFDETIVNIDYTNGKSNVEFKGTPKKKGLRKSFLSVDTRNVSPIPFNLLTPRTRGTQGTQGTTYSHGRGGNTPRARQEQQWYANQYQSKGGQNKTAQEMIQERQKGVDASDLAKRLSSVVFNKKLQSSSSGNMYSDVQPEPFNSPSTRSPVKKKSRKKSPNILLKIKMYVYSKVKSNGIYRTTVFKRKHKKKGFQRLH